VLGVGSVRKAAKVGKVGGLALGYFLLMSTVALAIGLVVGNIIEPGRLRAAGHGQERRAGGARDRPHTAAGVPCAVHDHARRARRA
jgi:aerobic C4-dicarboxylate transport protein